MADSHKTQTEKWLCCNTTTTKWLLFQRAKSNEFGCHLALESVATAAAACVTSCWPNCFLAKQLKKKKLLQNFVVYFAILKTFQLSFGFYFFIRVKVFIQLVRCSGIFIDFISKFCFLCCYQFSVFFFFLLKMRASIEFLSLILFWVEFCVAEKLYDWPYWDLWHKHWLFKLKVQSIGKLKSRRPTLKWKNRGGGENI